MLINTDSAYVHIEVHSWITSGFLVGEDKDQSTDAKWYLFQAIVTNQICIHCSCQGCHYINDCSPGMLEH